MGFTADMSTEPLSDPLAETSFAAHLQPGPELVTTASAPEATEPVAILAPPVALAALTAADSLGDYANVGRYRYADLQAMVGKRGRKPPEFYQAFPRSAESELSAKPHAGIKKVRAARTKALPAVSSAIIGDHTIDELLAMIGTTGRKPVAYEILQQSAQVFADAKAIDLPPTPVDPLVTAFAAAPKGVREAITALLAATRKN